MLFVPLDVEYDSDDKVIEAGPMAELLFVRGLAFSKRKLSDGRITRAQLTIVGRAIPQLEKHAARLVEVGLWEATPNGWVIVAWAKRNKSASEVAVIREARKDASARGNHAKWHVGPGKTPSTSCRFCSDLGSQTGSQTGSTESEVEPEPEVKPKDRQSSAQHPTARTDDDDFAECIELIVSAKLERYPHDAAKPYGMKVRTNTIDEDGPLIRALLDEGNTPAMAARHILGETVRTETPAGVAWCQPDCGTCHGDAFIDTGNGLAPCPQRTERTA